MSYDRTEFEVDGNRFAYRTEHDADTGAPWDEHDGHGPVSNVKYWRGGNGFKPPLRAGELLLYWNGNDYRTYDFAEACRIARRDGWNSPPYDVPGETARQRAAKAARADFERLSAWCNDDWHWCGVIVELLDDSGDGTGDTESLWGIESDGDEYHAEVARELASEIIARLETAAA